MVLDLLTLVRTAGGRQGGGGLLQFADEVRSPAEFAASVFALAVALQEAGLRAGDRVAILLHRCAKEAELLLAVAAAGGIAVPIHGKLRDDQVAHILADCEPFGVATSQTRVLALRDADKLLAAQRVWWVGGGTEAAAHDALGRLLAGGRLPAGSASPSDPGERLALPAPASAAALLYTSGSTGPQKGILQSHHNLCLGARLVADYLQLQPDDHVLALLPFSFDYGLNQLLSSLLVGCRLTAKEPLGPGELASLLLRVRPTGLAGVPSLWHEVARGMQSGLLEREHGRSLRYVTNSGGALQAADSRWIRELWPQVAVFAMYGLTEAFRSAYLPPAEFDAAPESFGRALPGVELLLVDIESGAVLEGPATGELVHAGALVALGYWRRPEATAARFRPDPRGRDGTVVYSGDLVRRDAAGRHFFVGRRDRQLKVSGHRVSPDEVAAAVRGMEGVGEVAVFGVPGGAEGHRIVMVVTGDVADPGLVAQVQRQCRLRLPGYLQPALVVVQAALPCNANGKLDEAALREGLQGRLAQL